MQKDLPPFDGFTLIAKYAILNGQQHTEEEQAAWGKVVAPPAKYILPALGFIGFTDIRMVMAEPTLGDPALTGKRRDEAVAKGAAMAVAF